VNVILSWFQFKAQPYLLKLNWARLQKIGFLGILSFILASSVSTFAANFALNLVTKSSPKSLTADDSEEEVVIALQNDDGVSPSFLKKSILERNLFNAEGKLAPEVEIGSGSTKNKDLDFAGVECSNEKMPIEVTGTIFTGDPFFSYVISKDSKVTDADVYKAGDVIIDYEDYEVYKVMKGSVEFRKGDSKICVDLKGYERDRNKGITNEAAQVSDGSVLKPENVESLDFDTAFVQQEIGPGYANILNSAKLIPEQDPSGKTIGFKIIAITPGSLFDKMKLQNGDVITEVNGVSLRDASQGFKLYQSLQEDREVNVNLLRNSEAMSRRVRIK
jgi:type II secretory pathway component PulC